MLLARDEPGDREKGLELLTQALDTAQELGMKALVEKALALKLQAQGIDAMATQTSIDAVAASVYVDKPDLKPHAAPDGTVTILFSDIEGSTAMTERLGDQRWLELLRGHNAIVRKRVAAHEGFEVKSEGDGFMLAFQSARRALECAVDIQRAFAERNASLPAHPVAKGDSPGREPVEGRAEPQPSAHPFDSAQDRASTGSARADRDVGAPTEAIRVRIGLNAGEPIAEDDPDGRGDLFGTAVIAAARIAAQAEGGEILVSNVVRELVAGKGFLFSSRGRTALRGFDDPVEVYEVRWQEEEG